MYIAYMYIVHHSFKILSICCKYLRINGWYDKLLHISAKKKIKNGIGDKTVTAKGMERNAIRGV